MNERVFHFRSAKMRIAFLGWHSPLPQIANPPLEFASLLVCGSELATADKGPFGMLSGILQPLMERGVGHA